MGCNSKAKVAALENVIENGKNIKNFLENRQKSLDIFFLLCYYKTYLDT